MKKGIHPDNHIVKFICSCGNEVDALSTIKDSEVRVEICSNCHPYYTGEQTIIKTGAVDKFYARMAKTKDFKK